MTTITNQKLKRYKNEYEILSKALEKKDDPRIAEV